MHMHTKEMKNKPWWVVRTEYYSTNVLAHQKMKNKSWWVARTEYYSTNVLAH